MQDLHWIESSSINPSVYSKMPLLMGQNMVKGSERENNAPWQGSWYFLYEQPKPSVIMKKGSQKRVREALCKSWTVYIKREYFKCLCCLRRDPQSSATTFMIKAKGTYTYERTPTHKHTLTIPWAFGSEALAGSDEPQHCYRWLQVSSTFSPLAFSLSQMLWQIPLKGERGHQIFLQTL